MKANLSKVYIPQEFEEEIYDWWERNGWFKPETQEALGQVGDTSLRFSITIPPPNVTGVLHLGHSITVSLQDLMIRYARMNGNKTLFLVGADHAGIATQNVVEREINKRGVQRKDIGREKFIEKVWEWKDDSLKRINNQLRKHGISSDWCRERFTLDDALSRSVREAFVRLYRKDLIYRGSYIINWCPGRCESAISDLESIPDEVVGKLYTIRYPIKTKDWDKPKGEWGDGSWAEGATEFIEIATTRPETLLGDSAIAIHPESKYWKKFAGGRAILPVLGRIIPVITDAYVDSEFGTGALKITPSHDVNDYKIGVSHKLNFYNIFNKKSVLHEEFGGKYAGLDRFIARKAICADLKKEGLLVKTEDYTHSIPHCERCKTIIEPRISVQWFVKAKILAKNVLDKIEDEGLNFVPKGQRARLNAWLDPETIHDWCISRQLWWGHQIPIWYCLDCSAENTGIDDPKECSSCKSKNLERDEDVLDTWFSSGLWPFSTMGWPEETQDFKDFYPNSTRETGYDILFFWVARELMLAVELTGKLPYKNIYFHGLVRSPVGEKISKSMENIDEYNPLNIIEKYGADSLRYALISYSTPGLDMAIDIESVKGAHKFGNKLWQATKFILSNLPEDFEYSNPLNYPDMYTSLADNWILTSLNQLIKDTTRLIDEYRFLEASREIRRFFWNSFADWYIEISKSVIYNTKLVKEGDLTKNLLVLCLDVVMRLLHPFMPFLSEKIWLNLPSKDEDALIIAKWPEPFPEFSDSREKEKFSLIQSVITSIRTVRSELNIPFKKPMPILISSLIHRDTILEGKQLIVNLTRADAEKMQIKKRIKPPSKTISVILEDIVVYIPLEGLIKIQEELLRIEKEIGKAEKLKKQLFNKLTPAFKERAPPSLVSEVEGKIMDLKSKISQLSERKSILAES